MLERIKLEYPSDPDELYANVLSILMDIYMGSEDYVNAENIFAKISDLKDQIDLPSDYHHAINVANFAFLYKKKRDFIKSLELYEKALQLISITQGADTLTFADVAKYIADIHLELGNYNLAKEYIDKVLRVYQQILKPTEIQWVEILNILGKVHLELSEIDQAEGCLTEALKICEDDPTSNQTLYAEQLNNLAALYDRKGEFTTSEKLYIQSLEITENLVGKNHPDYAVGLNNLGTCYALKADFAKGIEVGKEAIKIFESQPELAIKPYLSTINNLASNYMAIGEYREAEQLLTASVAWHYFHFGGAHPEYASALCDSAHLHMDLGNYEKADIEIQIAKRINSTNPGKDSLDYSSAIILQVRLCYVWGRFDEAIELNEEAMKIIRSRLGDCSTEYATLLNNQATVYQALSNLGKSASLIQESIRITILNLGIDHPITVKSRFNLGMILKKLGQLEKAEEIFKTTAKDVALKFGDTHQLYIFSMFELAQIKIQQGGTNSAIEVANQLIDACRKQVAGIFTVLSQLEKYKLMRNFEGLYDLINTISGSVGSDTLSKLYEWVVFRKSLVLLVTGNLNTFIAQHGNDALSEIYREWKSLVYKINRFQGLSNEQRINNDIVRLTEEAEQYEKRFNRMSFDLHGAMLVPECNLNDIINNLSEDEVLIDFVKYYDLQSGDYQKDHFRYGAYLIREDSVYPHFIDLVDGVQFETEVLPGYNCRSKEPDAKSLFLNDYHQDTRYAEHPDELFESVFSPLLPYFNNVKKLFLVLDGELHLINFNAMRNPSTGKYLIEEYEISYLAHPSSLKNSKTKKSPPKTAALFGYPDYDLLPRGVKEASPILQQYYASQPQMAVFREHEGLHFSKLPGTLDEVELVEEMLQLHNWEVTSFVEERATEANLRAVDSPGILLIATHTYFQSNEAVELDLVEANSQNRKVIRDHSMTDSSLLLAGANSYLSSNEEERLLFDDDGLFSAIEASMLKLTSTDLVILSVCSSGVGSVMRGEGVFGLQRGFFSAGTGSILMSLWKVDDDLTKEFISRFVKKYSKGVEKQTALRETQLELMKQNPDPFYWGSFVLVER